MAKRTTTNRTETGVDSTLNVPKKTYSQRHTGKKAHSTVPINRKGAGLSCFSSKSCDVSSFRVMAILNGESPRSRPARSTSYSDLQMRKHNIVH